LRFVADESCDFAVVRALRGAGFDVWAVAEQAPQSSDPEVLSRALEAQSVTEDKDFGWLVYASGRRAQGVILLRWPAQARAEGAATVVQTVQALGDRLYGSFVVVEPGRIRARRLPDREHE
jgi:predicted nuclease of predicted toxin-antitoxin system